MAHSSFSWSALKRPIIALAPMAGYTDTSYRQMVKEVCPEVVCFTEFTNVEGLLHGNDATLRQIAFNPDKERPIVAQIFGKKPEKFALAAKVLTEMGVDAIDINMGCPAKKIMSNDTGSALLKEPTLAEEIVRATVENTPLEVSAKMRIGTSCYDPDFFLRFAQSIEKAGAKLITIHGRTSKQMYSGTADWAPMYEVKKLLTVPVIGNGDIRSGADAVAIIGTLDGVMVGRGTFGNPWVFLDILAAFENKTYTPLTLREKIPTIIRHMELSCAFKGDHWGLIEMRKHLNNYIRGFPDAAEMRVKMFAAASQEEVIALLGKI